jgi:hypothetical protein
LLPETAEATSFNEAGSCSVCAQIEVRDTQSRLDTRTRQIAQALSALMATLRRGRGWRDVWLRRARERLSRHPRFKVGKALL